MSTYTFLRQPSQSGDLGTLGPYRVIRLLGDGAMGFVFLAEEPALDRRLALKVMRPEFSATLEGRERFIREAKASAKVESDHVITIYQVGEDNGAPYIAMELLEGMTLQEWLARRKNHPSIPLTSVFKVARDLFRGLADAHRCGLIHRDIKPSNLWIEKRTGRIKILDFGLTKAGDGSEISTCSGAIIGTPAYMAPEQANGQPVNNRADLFSAGVVLFEILTGKNPFRKGSILATLKAIGTWDAPSVLESRPDAPNSLAMLVDSLLKKDIHARPSDIQAAQAILSSAEKEFRAMSETSSTDSNLAFAQVESINKKVDEPTNAVEQSDPGPFLFDRSLQVSQKTSPKRSNFGAPLTIGLIGIGGSLLCLLVYFFFKSSREIEEENGAGFTKKSNNFSLQKKQNSDNLINPGIPGTIIKNDISKNEKESATNETKNTNKQTQISDNDIKTISKQLIQKNPGIKEPKISETTTHTFDCLLEGKELKDLSPLGALEGLKSLRVVGANQISDLTPLKDKKLEILMLSHSQTSDLSPLRGMPLKTVVLNFNQISSIDSFADMPLEHIEISGNSKILSLEPLRNSPIKDIRFSDTRISSLEPLRGKNIQFLEAGNCPISDLSPLAGMPIATLNVSATKVEDILPLKDCPITTLSLMGTKVKDLSPLKGKQIKTLVLNNISAVDISILKSIPVEEIVGVSEPIDKDLLSAWPNIKTINGKSRSTFLVPSNASNIPSTIAQATRLKPELVMDGHQNELMKVEFSNDGQQIASAGLNQWTENKDTVKIWSATDGKLKKDVEIFEKSKVSVSFSPDLKRVALGGHLKFGVWNIETNQKIFECDKNQGGVGGASGVAFSPDGKWLVGGENGLFQVFDTLRWGARVRWEAQSYYPNHEGLSVGSFCFSKDSKFLLFSVGKNQDTPNDIHLIDMQTRRLIKTLKGHSGGVTLAFSPNSRYVVSASRDRSVQFWDLRKTGSTIKPSKVLGSGLILPATCVSWSPDGKLVATGDSDGNLLFYEGNEARGFAEITELKIIKAHDSPVTSLDFSNDSKKIVTGGADKKIKIWSLPVASSLN